MARKYLDVEDFLGNRGPRRMTIRAIGREIIGGRPRLVVYFEDEDKGLILTRDLAEQISGAIGRSRMVDEFFATEGEQ